MPLVVPLNNVPIDVSVCETTNFILGIVVPIPTFPAKYAFPVVVAPPDIVSPPVCVPLPIVELALMRMPSVVVGVSAPNWIPQSLKLEMVAGVA